MDELKQRLLQWEVDTPPAALEDRLWREITAMPQHIPLGLRLNRALEQAFTGWQTGLAYKAAGLAFCAVLGFYVGTQQSTGIATGVSTQSDVEIADLALGRGNWMEGL